MHSKNTKAADAPYQPLRTNRNRKRITRRGRASNPLRHYVSSFSTSSAVMREAGLSSVRLNQLITGGA